MSLLILCVVGCTFLFCFSRRFITVFAQARNESALFCATLHSIVRCLGFADRLKYPIFLGSTELCLEVMLISYAW